MRVYSVHVRPSRPAEDPDVVLVRQSFSWLAALFPLLWALWHRLWLVLLIYVGALIAIGVGVALLEPSPPAEALLATAAFVATGALANDARRWTLGRAGYRLAGVVAAPRLVDAEHRFFSHWNYKPAGGLA